MHQFRPAEKWEAEKLTDIAIRAEAYWGYDDAFMDNFKETYRVTENFIEKNSTFIVYEKDEIIGFYAVVIGKETNELEYFYIDPPFIGKGYGKAMWNHMLGCCKETGIEGIELVTSPQAKEFYERMGAVTFAEVQSLLRKGRMIPKLRYVFDTE